MNKKALYVLVLGLSGTIFSACQKDKAEINPLVTVSGTLVDGVTKTPVSGATVTLTYGENEAENTATTGSDGRFYFEDVPFISGGQTREHQQDDSRASSIYTGVYGLTIQTNSASYRDNYVFYPIYLNFQPLGGDITGDNLAASLVIPLYKTNVNVTGRIIDSNTSVGLSGITAELYALGTIDTTTSSGFNTSSDILLASIVTGEDGRGTFEGVEQGIRAYVHFKNASNPSKTIDFKTDVFNIPTNEASETVTYDYGVVDVTSQNFAAPFYISDISPDDHTDVNINEPVSFTFSFSNPVLQNHYTRTDFAFGVGSGTLVDDIKLQEVDRKTVRKIGANYEVRTEWNETFTQLTVTPIDPLLDGYKYTLDMSTVFSKLEDNYCQHLVGEIDKCLRDLAEMSVVEFTTNGNDQAPVTPVLVRTNTNTLFDFSGGNVGFEITINNDAGEVDYYEIYHKKGDGHNEQFLTKVNVDDFRIFDKVVFSASTGSFLDGSNLVYDQSNVVEFRARAVSKNLRQSLFSNVISVKDGIKPEVLSASYSNADSSITVVFNEPMSPNALAVATNYRLEDSFDVQLPDFSIRQVEVIRTNFSDRTAVTRAKLYLNKSGLNPNQNNFVVNLVVSIAVRDLAANGLDNTDDDDDNLTNVVRIN